VNQIQVFDAARDSIKSELDADMSKIEFSVMLAELSRAIKSCGISSRNNPVRFFSRNYLKMSGKKYLEVREWLADTKVMSSNDIVRVLMILQQLRNGSLVVSVQTKKPSVVRAKKSAPPTSGLVRKIIDHAIGSFQSTVGLIAEAGIKPDLAFDSDRVQIQTALLEISKRFGITATFQVQTNDQPLTPEDLTEIGFPRGRRKS
jgi:hypothetical protein